MDRKVFGFFVFLALALSVELPAVAQGGNSYVLKGYMGVQGGESFNYDLVLRDSNSEYLTGHSLLYKTKANEVKTAVVAKRDRQNKTLRISETAIVYNNNFKSKAVICLVEASLQIDKDEQVLKGSLTTQTINHGPECSRGSIVFSNQTEIQQFFEQPSRANQKPEKVAVPAVASTGINPTKKLDAYMAEQQRRAMAQSQQERKDLEKKTAPAADEITEGQDGVYEWHSEEIVLEIWDGNYEDGDRVTLQFNGQEVLSNYTLKNEKKRLVLKIPSGRPINTITVLALNEGGQPPNTANISISDGDKTHHIVANNKIGRKATIKIKKVAIPEKQG